MSWAGLGSAGRARRGLPRRGLGLGGLALVAASDAEPQPERGPCRASGVAVQVFEGSRLFEAPGDELALFAGRQLDCDRPPARRVLAALAEALGSLRGAGAVSTNAFTPATLARAAPEGATRVAGPLRVHLDPRLPSRQAPLAGVEVHVSGRELLVARSRLAELGPEVWRHELLHTLAPPPPAGPSTARRLWLTLEEALVSHVERATAHAPPWPGAAARGAPEARALALMPPRLAVPVGEWLASPAYDPHPLAAGLARELEQGAAVPVAAWVRCLAKPPSALPAAAAAADVFRAFGARCSPDAASELSRAIGSWWVEAQPPPGRASSGARDREPRLARARKAAAPAGESR